MKKEDIYKDLEAATFSLLEMAREECWNKISNNCIYYLSKESEYSYDITSLDLRRRSVYKNKTLLPLEVIAQSLEEIYIDLYDVNLYIFKAEKKQTIIEIRCDFKHKFDPNNIAEKEYYEFIKCDPPMLHCKIAIPPYAKKDYESENEKYDVNWTLGGWRHHWKLFWWRRRMKSRYGF